MLKLTCFFLNFSDRNVKVITRKSNVQYQSAMTVVDFKLKTKVLLRQFSLLDKQIYANLMKIKHTFFTIIL